MGPLTLATSASVYVYANATISSAERVEPYRSLMAPLCEQTSVGRFTLASSELVVLEELVRPLREGNARLEVLYRSLLDTAGINLTPATLSTFARAPLWIRLAGTATAPHPADASEWLREGGGEPPGTGWAGSPARWREQ